MPQDRAPLTPGVSILLVFVAVTWLIVYTGVSGCGKKDEAKPSEPLEQPTPKVQPQDLPKPEIPETALPGAPQWTFGSNAISLQLKADSTLNLFEGNPHTLVLCVYQLADPNAYKDLASTKEGVVKLLAGQKFGETVSAVDRIIIQPGETRTVFLDRAVGAQYVGLVAGFFELDPAKASKLFQIPLDVSKKGLIFKDTYMIPGRLDLSIFL
ncbi:MAG: type VI secretion system lipoprotein TssJ, partial [Thermodesulfobacteriota bacterium]